MKWKRIFRKNNLKKFFSNNVLFLSYIIISILIECFLRVFTVGGHFYLKAVFADISFLLFIGSFGYLFKPKSRFNYFLTLIIIYSALAIGNVIYFQFYKSFISVDLLATASMMTQVNDSLFAKLRVNQFLFLLFPLIFILINIKLKKIKYYEKLENSEEKIKFKNVITPIGVIVVFLLIVSIYDIKSFYNPWRREKTLQKYGLYVYTINDMVQSIHSRIDNLYDYDNSSLSYRNYYSCKWKDEKIVNEYTNKFKDKNILFIHMESIQNFLVNLKINDKEVIPFLNKLSKEGIYFNKFYPQISVGTSSDTEFTIQTGLMPSSKGTVFVNYYDRNYKSMVNYFNKMNYYTFSAHANNREYWNRDRMYNTIGYDNFIAKDNFDIDEDNSDFIGLGLSDKEFFNQLIPKLKEIKDNHEKYYGTIITLTNHSPFSYNDTFDFNVNMEYSYTNGIGRKITSSAPYLEGTVMGNYIRSAHYADSALKQLFNDLEKNNLLDNTVIVLYGDHEARLAKNEFELLYNYDPISKSILDSDDENYISMDNYAYDLLRNTPLIIWSKDEDLSREVNKTMGAYDLLPTIANMFGFEEKYSLGHDIFNDDEGIVVFPNGNVLTDNVYYSVINEEYISLNENPIGEDYIDNIKSFSDKVLEVSNGIIFNDLIEKEGTKVGKCNKK